MDDQSDVPVADINNAFDDIFMVEDKICAASYDKGFKKGFSDGRVEGYHLGYHRGAEVGGEIGFYGSFSNAMLNSESISLSDKARTTLLQLQNSVVDFPQTNVSDVDIKERITISRNLYKKTCSLLKVTPHLPYSVT